MKRAAGRAVGALAVALALCALASPARSQAPPEPEADPQPPPEAEEGADYEVAIADSLAEDGVEFGLGAYGRQGGGPRRRRRVRVRDGSFEGSVLEGEGDPLAGGDARIGRGGRLALGRLSPRWGRGLVLGAAADPWSGRAGDRGRAAPVRGRAGEGASWSAEGGGLEALLGRFSRRDLAGARVGSRGWSLGAVAGRRGGAQAGVGLERADGGVELALDRAGPWRLEGSLEREVGGALVGARVRGGSDRWRSLAEPRRSGPSRALAVAAARRRGGLAISAMGALWRFRARRGGARAALELRTAIKQHGSLALGFEEQHGARRDPVSRVPGLRQGLWGEWRGGPPALVLSVRHEVWGARPFARDRVRAVTVARAEARTAFGGRLRVTHSAYRVRRGESLYLAEVGVDRIALRAVTGRGARTRVELRMPAGRGRIEAALDVVTAAGDAPRILWSLDWTRRARTRRAAR